LQKSGILLTIISLFATIAVTMVSKGNMIAAIIFVALGVVACGYLAFAKTKEA
ncbi:MAG TPA: Na+-transporting malonate decarboxylase, carboxybiotin decarboxylase subunit, madB, partial [Lactobacillus sp.]|nr:Na+-transporting malonate decarboxylase, carboxybiotin decarboxylase subunit, madB [Lactobacillus sp.]